MYAVAFTLRPTRDGSSDEWATARLTDIFWSRATPSDGLEHVYVSAVAGHVEVTLFVQAGDHADADRRANQLCQRVIDLTPILVGWTFARC